MGSGRVAMYELRPIPGWPNYMASSDGRIWSNKTGIFLKPNKMRTGYESVELFNNGKSKRVSIHRLIASAFISNPHNFPCVNHKNEIRNDNRAENLEWCTHYYNMHYGNCQAKIKANRKISKEQLRKFHEAGALANIRQVTNITTGKEFNSIVDASRFYKVSASHISETCKGKRKSAGGYKWAYIEG